MSNEIKIELPKLGESILSATVVQWLKRVGDTIELDEALLEVSTDKVNSEIPSPVRGVLKEILVEVDQEVEVGAALAVVSVTSATDAPKLEAVNKPVTAAQNEDQSLQDFYSPSVLQLAKQEGVAFSELEKIPGTGQGGRITKKDIEHYVESRKKSVSGSAVCPKASSTHAPVSSDSTVSKIKITGLRKAIADTMIRSYREVPHAALVNEIDVTELVKFIQEEKESFLATHGVKLTLTSFIAKAISQAVVQYPLLNASVEGDTIIVKHSVNVGIAVGVEHGVIVPVVKHCERKNIAGIAKEVADLAIRTRNSQLQHEDVLDGTITLTNFGMTGTRLGFPIIRHPEVAIVGVGAVQKRVMVISDDTIAIRSMMDISLCFDHRVIDGLYGCGFINAIRDHLQKPKELMQMV